MAHILVTEKISDSGLERLRAAGHDVRLELGPSPAELLDHVREAEALIIRSATTVTAEVIEAGRKLVVIGRAGIGLDNVDVEAATGAGVMVANAPHANALSAAEHAMALLLAQARNVPQASAALKAGRWERSVWEGVELADKTIGIVGLGQIGRLVADRCQAFGMDVIAHDPFVAPEAARKLKIELMELSELMARADFVSLHLVRTPETVGLIDADMLAAAKPGIRIINVARGGIIDEAALAESIASGHVAGAALDVFDTEPTTESPLFDLPSVVVTPHLGASTVEAQDKAGDTIADQVALALDGQFVPFAVNVSAGDVSETVQPFVELAEHLGALYSAMCEEADPVLDITYGGQIASVDTRILTLGVLKGFFRRVLNVPVSYVNAPVVASERGVEVREISTEVASEYVNLVTVSGAGHSVAGTVIGLKGRPRIVAIDNYVLDVPPSEHMIVIRNADEPGMIGVVGSVLGRAGVNIDNMGVGKDEAGMPSTMLLSIDQPLPEAAAEELRRSAGILSVHTMA